MEKYFSIYEWIIVFFFCCALLFRCKAALFGYEQSRRKSGISRIVRTMYVICIMVLFLVMALRAQNVGCDLVNYRGSFIYRDTDDVKNSWVEPGFKLLNLIIGQFTDDFQVVMAIYAVLIIAGPCFLIYKYSKNCFYSLALYIVMGFYVTALSSIRTSIAISLLCFAFDAALEKKTVRFLVLLLLAILIHRTALVYLIVYWVSKKRITKRYVFGFFLAGLIIYLVRKPLFSFIVRIPIFSKYARYIQDTGSFTYAALIFCVLSVMLLFYSKAKEVDDKIELFYHMVLLAFVSQTLATINTNMSRLTDMLYFPAVILFPNVIESLKNVLNRRILYFAITIVLIAAYYVVFRGTLSTLPYAFFWQI